MKPDKVEGTRFPEPEYLYYTYNEPLYNAIKKAVQRVAERHGTNVDSVQFDDDARKVTVYPSAAWFLISVGIHTNEILNEVI